MILTFRSPVAQPLYPPRGTKPRMADEFYVTQRFDDPDYYWANVPNPPSPLPTHRATDIGNARCGYPILAMAPGTAYRIKDNASSLGAPTDALGIRVDHGHGITTEYWHLDSWSVPTGVRVSAGQEIGRLGKTGLGAVCHCHIEAKRDGIRFDPEPLMFGGSITLEDDVNIPNGRYLVRGSVGPGNRLRVDPATIDGSQVLGDDIGEPKAYAVQVYQRGVKGQPYTLGGKPGDTYSWIGVFGRTWFVADPLITDLTVVSDELPSADCVEQEQRVAQLSTDNAALQARISAAKAALG